MSDIYKRTNTDFTIEFNCMGGNTAFGYLYKYSFFVLYIVNYFDFTKKRNFCKKNTRLFIVQ